jgi:phospholipid/cholesterol/gamma-HCH transport system permease protein
VVRSIRSVLEYIGGITILAGHILRLILRGKVNIQLLLQQMVLTGVNSIPITGVVMCFAGSVFTYTLAGELDQRGAARLTGSLLMLMLVRELVPIFVTLVLIGKVGAAVTSELGTMTISEQIDALRALATDPDYYLTVPRVLAVVLMIPVVALYGGVAGWYAGYLTAHVSIGQNYAQFSSAVSNNVGPEDLALGFIKIFAFGLVLALTACYFGYRARGGASGVGVVVTRGVVVNILLLFVLDLIITASIG